MGCGFDQEFSVKSYLFRCMFSQRTHCPKQPPVAVDQNREGSCPCLTPKSGQGASPPQSLRKCILMRSFRVWFLLQLFRLGTGKQYSLFFSFCLGLALFPQPWHRAHSSLLCPFPGFCISQCSQLPISTYSSQLEQKGNLLTSDQLLIHEFLIDKTIRLAAHVLPLFPLNDSE